MRRYVLPAWLRRRPDFAEAAAIAVVVLLAALLAWTTRNAPDEPTPASAPEVRAAESYVVALTSVDHRRIDTQIQSIRDSTTGRFRARFDDGAAAFGKAVRTSRIRSAGRVVSAGLVSSTDEQATVLVAARASVRSKGQVKAVERRYRFRIVVSRVDDEWRVSGVKEL